MSNIFKKTAKVLQSIVFATMLVFLVLVGLSFLPFDSGPKTFTVQSGSMEPFIKTGSVIFVLPAKTYSVGDVVTRESSNSAITVTHRIIEKNEAGFVTKGDANNVKDPEALTKDAIVGKLMLKIPFLGYPIAFARTAKGLVLLILIPSLFVIFDEALNIKNELSKIKKKRARANSTALPKQKIVLPIRILSIETKTMPKEIRHLMT